MSGFGFEVPQGDPGAMDAAAAEWRTLGVAFDAQGQAVGAASQVALGAGSWEGQAASAFAGRVESLIGALRSNVDACATAASVLSQLAQALESAQRTAYAAQARGQHAVQAYHQGRGLAARLLSAASELKPTPELGHGWADSVVTWAGHVNDFSGAGAPGVIKGYDQAIALAMTSLDKDLEQLKDPAVQALVMNNQAVPGLTDQESSLFGRAANAEKLADNPLTKFFTEGLPQDSFGSLSEVPYLAVALSAVDVGLNWHEEGAQSLVAPAGNLVAGTVITHYAAPIVARGAFAATDLAASGAEFLGADGLATTLAGSALIPGVGEAVIVGGVVVVGTYYLDKGATWVWNHGGAQVASEAWHGVEQGASGAWHGIEHGADWAWHEGGSLVHTGEHVVHDLEPWNWSL
jgi:uncharacterized protein YukE